MVRTQWDDALGTWGLLTGDSEADSAAGGSLWGWDRRPAGWASPSLPSTTVSLLSLLYAAMYPTCHMNQDSEGPRNNFRSPKTMFIEDFIQMATEM